MEGLSRTRFPPNEMITLEEALHILEEGAEVSDLSDLESDCEDNVQDVFITPPDPSSLTDEDSGDDDDGGLVDNLSRKQLNAQAELKFTSNRRIGSVDEHIVEASRKRKWIDGDLTCNPSGAFEKVSYEKFKYLTPRQCFELFFDEDVIQHIADESKKYAGFKNYPDPDISVQEIKVFLGILIVSGYCRLPGRKAYWDSKPDMNNEMVSSAMRRDRFIRIMRCIHLADNNCIDHDKMYKLRPLANMLKDRFRENFQPVEHLSYDEAMIRYFGRHSCKQFIRGKPMRFGYKAWCLNTDFEYLVDFEIYQGKNVDLSDAASKAIGKAASPLVRFIECLPVEKKAYPYKFFFDNLFTGFNLLYHLKAQGYYGTGSIRDHRVPRDCPLRPKAEMQKAERGSMDKILEKTDGIAVVRWRDNSVVTVASTAFGTIPVMKAKRFNREKKKKKKKKK